ncbi:MAG: hypothetical protein ACQES8_09050 [Thermodesulfobacteriota bacterium]
MAEQFLRITKARSLFYILLCSIGVLGFFLIALVPNQFAIKDLRQETREMETRISRQEVFYPFYQKMLGRLRELENKNMPLPFNKKKGLDRNKLNRIKTDFNRAAGQAGIGLEIVPDLTSLTKSSEDMMVDGKARGDFLSFREFLIEIGKIPYLQQVEQIEIQALTDDIRYKIKCRIALKKK